MPAPKNTGKRSLKGIPENLKPLARDGKRVRFNGGWLNESDQDRFLAEWIDNTTSSWAVMKALLYQMLQGGGFAPIEKNIADDTPDEFSEAEWALINFED